MDKRKKKDSLLILEEENFHTSLDNFE